MGNAIQSDTDTMLDAGISIVVIVTCILLFVRTRAYLDVGPIAITSPSWNSQRISLEAAIYDGIIQLLHLVSSTPHIIITASITITPFPPLLSLRVLLLLLRLLLLPYYILLLPSIITAIL